MSICIFAFVIRKSYLCLEIFETTIYTQIAAIIPLVITLDNYRNLWKVLPEWKFDDEWQRQQDKYFGRETLS